MKYDEDSDLFLDQLYKNVLAKVTLGTNYNVSEEINAILNVPFKQECNINLMYLCIFKGTYIIIILDLVTKKIETSISLPNMG